MLHHVERDKLYFCDCGYIMQHFRLCEAFNLASDFSCNIDDDTLRCHLDMAVYIQLHPGHFVQLISTETCIHMHFMYYNIYSGLCDCINLIQVHLILFTEICSHLEIDFEKVCSECAWCTCSNQNRFLTLII